MKKSLHVKLWLNKDGVSSPAVAKFNESVVDVFQDTKDDTIDHTHVSHSFYNNNLLLTKDPNGKLLTRPPFCPIKFYPNPPEIENENGIPVASCVLLQSSDNAVFLTKRSPTMRSFPNVWVPPGGHVDHGENFETSGLRELHEETSLNISNSDHSIINSCEIIGFWESVFPPRGEMGKPIKHHIVAYVLYKSLLSSSELTKHVSLHLKETNACAWICPCLAKLIVETDSQFIPFSKPIVCSSNCHATDGKCHGIFHCQGTNRKLEGQVISIKGLLNTDFDLLNGERVSTGTKYALDLWLKNFLLSTKT